MLPFGADIRRAVEIAMGTAVAATGAVLLWLAIPIGAAGLAELTGNATLKSLSREAPGAAALRRLIRSREASMAWREKGRTATDLALARMLLGERGSGAERGEQFALAEEALAKGLGLAPMDPYGWMRMAWIGMAARRSAGEVAPALSLAINCGPHENRMIMLAVETGLYAWGGLAPSDRDLVADRVRQAWRSDALRTAEIAARAGRTDLLARLVLRGPTP